MNIAGLSFSQRASQYWASTDTPAHQIARNLLLLMDRKRTNLSLSIDVTSSTDLLRLSNDIGPYICVLKTHIDILSDFTPSIIEKLQELARMHDFMIFEDRKFADIGNTVYNQYTGGIYKISQWAHITNAHSVPGDGIIAGIKKGIEEQHPRSAGAHDCRGLLMLAEMSSAGSLATGDYTKQTVRMASSNRDVVFGFVAGRRLEHDGDFLYFSPGVQLESGTDALGQQYRTPEVVLGECMSDIVIVGRGICGAKDPKQAAQTYRDRCWSAYLKRIQQEQ